ncbi:MAG: ComEC/Rec2 family competence protein [Candidatus Paceibacterota bacterium]|jgi:competence protein ComEC
MRDKIFYLSCFGFEIGVLISSFFFVNLYLITLISIVFLGLFLFFLFVSKLKWCILFCIFILTISLGIFRFHNADKPAPYVFESIVGEKVNFSGLIIDEVDERENNQKLTVEVLSPQGLDLDSLKAKPFPAKTKILLTADFEQEFKYGDTINFFGKLEKPENFYTNTGKLFDYINYLHKDGIFYLIKNPTTEIISRGGGSFVKRKLFSFKDKFLDKINFVIPEPESLLMGGLILGERSSFDESMRQAFVDTGTIHIIALSGYNVTIVAEWIMKIFSFFPRNISFSFGIFGILLFVVMAGGASTAVRAGVMATLALIARATGRDYDVARALVFAGVIMTILNPFVLAFDVSFQLSFIATIAVIFFAPKMEKYFMWITKRFGLRDVVCITFSAYLFVLPFILYKMGNLSIVALPANILILPFIPITMIFGFITGFIGLIWSVFSIPFGFVSYLFLHYELSIISFFSHLSFASFAIPNFPLLITLIVYTYFIYRLFGKNIKKFFN